MSEGMTCYARDEAFCDDQMCLRTGCRLQKSATEQDYLEDNIATVAFHLGRPGARLSVSHPEKSGLIVDPGEVLKEVSRRLSIPAQQMPIRAPSNDQLSGLWNAIVENTKGDGFWIGEILLSVLEREVGFNPAALGLQIRGTSSLPSTESPPPDWKQDQAETSRLPRKSTESGSGK